MSESEKLADFIENNTGYKKTNDYNIYVIESQGTYDDRNSSFLSDSQHRLKIIDLNNMTLSYDDYYEISDNNKFYQYLRQYEYDYENDIITGVDQMYLNNKIILFNSYLYNYKSGQSECTDKIDGVGKWKDCKLIDVFYYNDLMSVKKEFTNIIRESKVDKDDL